MAYLLKLLYNMKIYLKYVTYALVIFFFGIILRTLSRYVIYHYHQIYMNSIIRSGIYSDNNPYDTKQSEAGKRSVPTKYILLWDSFYGALNGDGEPLFPTLQCPVNNCIITKDRYLFGDDYTRFDALLFGEAALKNDSKIPAKRSRHQIYVFNALESAYNHPACELHSDDFYNWTFTYRLDSDILWSYFLVRDVSRRVVAPSKHVVWKVKNRTLPRSIKYILDHKTKAAAWLVSHCEADSLRDDYMSRLQAHLFHYSLKIDVYGSCTKAKCTNDDCEEMFTRDYYFYMAFENSFSEDYVTEKVLHGYNNYVVPIVFGGANYSRFLPPGSYLNARELHPYNLAYLIHEAVKNPAKYKEYFKWTNSYIFDVYPPGLHPLCNLCAALHSKKAQRPQVYRQFRRWWNGLNGMKWCLPEEFWNETARVNVDGRHIFDVY